MENKPAQVPKVILPTIAELFAEVETLPKTEGLNAILNVEPPQSWVKTHPYAKDHKYIPIDKVEYLLRKIFKQYRIEITGNGTAFNGVWVTVRVWYLNPATNDLDYHDGIGAAQLQTKQGSSPADLQNINNGALAMAFPIAKTLAVKDACHHFGKIFGADLDRKYSLPFTADQEILSNIKTNKQKLNATNN